MNKKQHIILLRLLLAAGAFGWGISILGVLLPWRLVTEGLGAGEIPSVPMLDYWLRMASGGFFIIGVLFAVSAWNPKKYWAFIPLLGWLNIFEGLILLIHGLRLGLQPFPFYCDVSFCLLIGIGVVIPHTKAGVPENSPMGQSHPSG